MPQAAWKAQKQLAVWEEVLISRSKREASGVNRCCIKSDSASNRTQGEGDEINSNTVFPWECRVNAPVGKKKKKNCLAADGDLKPSDLAPTRSKVLSKMAWTSGGVVRWPGPHFHP